MRKIQKSIFIVILVIVNIFFIGYVWIYTFDNQKRIFKEYYLYSLEKIIKNSVNEETIVSNIESELINFSKNLYFYKGKKMYHFISGEKKLIEYEGDAIKNRISDHFAGDCVSQKKCLLILIKSRTDETWRIEIKNYLNLTQIYLIQIYILGFLVINLLAMLVYILLNKILKSEPGTVPDESHLE